MLTHNTTLLFNMQGMDIKERKFHTTLSTERQFNMADGDLDETEEEKC